MSCTSLTSISKLLDENFTPSIRIKGITVTSGFSLMAEMSNEDSRSSYTVHDGFPDALSTLSCVRIRMERPDL